MIERGSSKHGPELDEQMKREVEDAERGGRPSHSQEWPETEPFTEETTETEAVPSAGGEASEAVEPSDDRGGDNG